jgi:hypothetical protein
MKLYFDCCCWGRHRDNQKQDKIRNETEAIKNIIKLAQWHGYSIFGSMALDDEIGALQGDDPEKYDDVWGFYQRTITERATAKKRAFECFEALALQAGARKKDTLHLCLAISADADYLLTTDKKFIAVVGRITQPLPLVVINPLIFPLGGVI